MTLDFLIIGAQKAASTFVHECLLDHPDVFMPREEIGYFEDPYFSLWPAERFEALFRDAPNGARVGIKRPDYLGRAECPARIYAHSPNARLIAILRRPLDRAVSAYFWFVYQGYIPAVELNAGFRAILRGDYARAYPKSAEILEYGRYWTHLQQYGDYFGREQLYIGWHEDFQKDSVAALKEIYGFLGIGQAHRSQAQHRRPKPSVYALARLKILRLRNPFVYRYHKWDNGNLTLTLRRGVLSYGVRGLFHAMDRLLLARIWNESKPEFDSDVEAALMDFYADEILGLEAETGRNLQHWKAKNVALGAPA